MATAFQVNAFQNNSFQISTSTSTGSSGNVWSLSGVTRGLRGAPLGNCQVLVFDSANYNLLGSGTSDGGGNYDVTLSSSSHNCFVVSYLAGSPDNAGTTSNLLVPTASLSYVGPGDVLGASAFTAYWGLRAFSKSTIGNKAVKLRRASDSATMDFVTLSDGTLDAASIATFKGASSLTIAKFYDQTGNGYDVTTQSSAYEQAFTANTLNGMGVYDNSAGNGTMYTVPITSTILNTYSHSFLATWKTIITSFSQWQFIVGTIDDEISMIANDGGGGQNNAAIKNEGVAGPADFLYTAAQDGQWHASVGVIDQTHGHASGIKSSFFNVDNAATNTADLGGNPGVTAPFLAMAVWGETGNGPNTNQLVGYGAEAAWFAIDPAVGSPWSQTQATALIANAKAFWGI